MISASSLLVTPSTVDALAATLVQFLWQGLLIGLVGRCLLYVLDPRAPQSRYAIHLGMLALLSIAPVVTFCWLIARPSPTINAVGVAPFAQAADVRSSLVNQFPLGWRLETTLPSDVVARTNPLQWLQDHSTSVASIWLLGAAAMIIRLALGAVGLWSLLRRRLPIPSEVLATTQRLAARMAFKNSPKIAMIEGISQAMAVGVLRPMVLLPAAWVLELPPEVLEAVIAHELAHLRRWDLAVNLWQRAVETVLFFHPVVWWCSRQLRVEREMCCDELAQAAIGNRLAYAQALTHLAQQQRFAADALLVAGIGGSNMALLERIRRVLGLVAKPRGRFYGPSCVLIGAVVASIVWAIAVGLHDRVSSIAPPERVDEDSIITGTFHATEALPSEKAKVLLPGYTIEPPDVLLIEALRVIPKPPYHIHAGDELSLIIEPADYSLRSGKGFIVDPEGRISLGPRLPKAQVGGLTVDEATQVVLEILKTELRGPEVSITVVQTSGIQPVTGEHLVSPDGTVRLGMYGSVRVAGMKLDEARTAIEQQLSKYLDDPQVSITPYAYNSKVYYVITELAAGDQVARLPITGSETVLDAISHVNGLKGLGTKKIWIARPQLGDGGDMIIPVDWTKITKGASTATNYQILPGDRIFVSDHAPPKAVVKRAERPASTTVTRY